MAEVQALQLLQRPLLIRHREGEKLEFLQKLPGVRLVDLIARPSIISSQEMIAMDSGAVWEAIEAKMLAEVMHQHRGVDDTGTHASSAPSSCRAWRVRHCPV